MPTLAVITTPRWGDLLMLGALVVGFVWMAYLGIQAIKLWIELMRLVQHGKRSLEEATRKAEYADFDADPADDDMTAVMDGLREKRTEPMWSGKAQFDEPADPHSVPNVLVLAAHPVAAPDRPERIDLTSVLPASGHLDEKPAEISHPRHSADDTETGLIPVVVDDEAAMDAVAAVSGQDGAS